MSLDEPDIRDAVYLAMRNKFVGKTADNPYPSSAPPWSGKAADQAADCVMELIQAGILAPASYWQEPIPLYDPEFGDQRECECGHPYYRHFDWMEDNAPVGCKYCGCGIWTEPEISPRPPWTSSMW